MLRSVSLLVGSLLVLSSSFAADSAANVLRAADSFAGPMPTPLRGYFRTLYAEGEWNAVLNLDRLGLAAMQEGEFGIAAAAFDMAIARIEAIYADDPGARKAKSLYSAESVKDFKGEPYERSMTYYYRGVLYLRDGDYQNARAMFLSAERQDSFSEVEEFRSDFGAMNYLAAWASRCDGDDVRAAELLEAAKKSEAGRFATLTLDHAYLALLDAGSSPTKGATGKYREELHVLPASSPVAVKSVAAEDLALTQPVELGDIGFQATTRGGRPVEVILKGKARFKSRTDTISTVAGVAGQTLALQGVYSGDSNMVNAGLSGMGISLISGLFSAATTPAADTRYWNGLPSALYVSFAEALPEALPGAVFTWQQKGDTQESQSSSAFAVIRGQCGLSWSRTHRVVPPDAGLKPEIKEDKRAARNAGFRAELENRFNAALLAAGAATRTEQGK